MAGHTKKSYCPPNLKAFLVKSTFKLGKFHATQKNVPPIDLKIGRKSACPQNNYQLYRITKQIIKKYFSPLFRGINFLIRAYIILSAN
jgi:hypothetical protein